MPCRRRARWLQKGKIIIAREIMWARGESPQRDLISIFMNSVPVSGTERITVAWLKAAAGILFSEARSLLLATTRCSQRRPFRARQGPYQEGCARPSQVQRAKRAIGTNKPWRNLPVEGIEWMLGGPAEGWRRISDLGKKISRALTTRLLVGG